MRWQLPALIARRYKDVRQLLGDALGYRIPKEPVITSSLNVIYLACPYTDPDHAVRQSRFEIATTVAAQLIRAGRIVYSPITMTHPIDQVLAGATNTLGSDYWVAFDEAFMEMCTEMVVICIEGWEKSNGVRREIEYFTEHKKPIRYMDPLASTAHRP